MDERINNLVNKFKKEFKTLPTDVFSSPGRIELLGNHTDHNHGKVIVSSIDLNIMAVSKPNNDGMVRYIYQIDNQSDFKKIEVNINNLNKEESEYGTIKSIIKGILKRLKELNYSIGGLDIVSDTLVPLGAGVSSSASFEDLITKMESYYFNHDNLNPYEIAQVSQYAECEYFGKPCGLLDQLGISLGGINLIDFKDPNKLIYQSLKESLNEYQLLLINTHTSHEGLTPYYAAVKNDMIKIANYFNCKVLREVEYIDIQNKKEELIKQFGEKAYLRAIHFYEENERVEMAYNSLLNHDYDTFLKVVKASGLSSYYQLGNCYCESEDEIYPTYLRKVANIDDKASSRVHGGGFAGTILMIVPKVNLDNDLIKLQEIFNSDQIIKVSLSNDGTKHLLKL